MSELHKFIFDGLPVRGMLVRLTGDWQEVLRRREASGPWPEPVRDLVGELSAAAMLMRGNLKFEGALVVQVFGDGPVKLAVAEARSTPEGLAFRATAKVVGELPAEAGLPAMVNAHGKGRCAITLDPDDKRPGQQPYQGVVGLHGDEGEPLEALSEVLEHYMLQSEQLDTRLVLAADGRIAAGLLIQRMPVEGEANLEGQERSERREAELGQSEDFERIALLAATLTREELLTLDAAALLRRLFWEEPLRVFEPDAPRFSCTCSRRRVGAMLQGLGREEVDGIIAERGEVEVGCEFCGLKYRFDAVDVGEMFVPSVRQSPGSSSVN